MITTLRMIVARWERGNELSGPHSRTTSLAFSPDGKATPRDRFAAPIDGDGRPSVARTVINKPLEIASAVPTTDPNRVIAVIAQPDSIPREIRIIPGLFDEIRKATGAKR